MLVDRAPNSLVNSLAQDGEHMSINENDVVYAMRFIRYAIQRASARHDTVEGIHGFWIEWSEPVPPMSVTQVALERLAAEGMVEPIKMDDRVVWRRCRPV